MSVAVWPATLPTQASEGFKDASQAQYVEARTDTGPPIRRRRTNYKKTRRSFILQMTGTVRATLETFYDDTLEGGTLPFDWTNGDPVTGNTVRYQFIGPPPAFTNIVRARVPANRVYETTLNLRVIQ